MSTSIVVLLRIIHIFAGVAWVGSVWMVVGFLIPTAEALGMDGGKFLGYMTNVRRFPMVIAAAGGLNVLAGLLLYYNRFNGINITTPSGLAFSIGAVSAITALAIGGAVVGRDSVKLANLGATIAKAGKPPSPEQLAELGRLQGTLKQAAIVVAVLLAITLLGMASGRYL
jgi:uncharacterized membrane protein